MPSQRIGQGPGERSADIVEPRGIFPIPFHILHGLAFEFGVGKKLNQMGDLSLLRAAQGIERAHPAQTIARYRLDDVIPELVPQSVQGHGQGAFAYHQIRPTETENIVFGDILPAPAGQQDRHIHFGIGQVNALIAVHQGAVLRIEFKRKRAEPPPYDLLIDYDLRIKHGPSLVPHGHDMHAGPVRVRCHDAI
ncbi:MAG: hypothetical protein WCC64_17265 [Aliidongia sp.]